MSRPIFVFGSNEAGIHGAGAAKVAREKWGATLGKGFGPSEDSFAIPTKDWHIETLPLEVIENYVNRFNAYARKSGDMFHLTKIGCGYAGYTEPAIAPLFKDAPGNVVLINEQGVALCLARDWHRRVLGG